MTDRLSLEGIYAPSEDVVAREIEGELIIVPLTSGIGDLEDDLYSLNETGKAIWHKLDGVFRLKDVIGQLTEEFDGSITEIEEDVMGLVQALIDRKIVVEIQK